MALSPGAPRPVHDASSANRHLRLMTKRPRLAKGAGVIVRFPAVQWRGWPLRPWLTTITVPDCWVVTGGCGTTFQKSGS